MAGESLVRVSGRGHREALQRVLSQDVLRLRPGEGALALLLAPKGQFRAIMAMFVDGKQSFLLAPPGTRLTGDGREFEVTSLPLW
jgi:glycine cleavage system aminomethyltransferase T